MPLFRRHWTNQHERITSLHLVALRPVLPFDNDTLVYKSISILRTVVLKYSVTEGERSLLCYKVESTS